MSQKKSFVVYSDYLQHVEMLDMEQRGRLFTALLRYAETGEVEDLDGMTAMAFSFMRAQIDRDTAKWEETRLRRSLAGRKGGLARAARAAAEERCTFGEF